MGNTVRASDIYKRDDNIARLRAELSAAHAENKRLRDQIDMVRDVLMDSDRNEGRRIHDGLITLDTFERNKPPCRHDGTAQLGSGWFQCSKCGATFNG